MTNEGKGQGDCARSIILSPHPDDAALSIGGALIAGYFRAPVLLVTICTRTSDESVRAEEDLKYAKCVKVRLLRLGLLDTPLRNWPRRNPLATMTFSLTYSAGTLSQLVQRRQNPRFLSNIRYILSLVMARMDSQFYGVQAVVERLLRRYPDCVIVSPLGIGDHPDHLIVANVAKRLQGSGRRVIFYEDLPYVSKFTPEEAGVQVRLFDGKLRPTMLEITDVYAKKRENLAVYDSQQKYLRVQIKRIEDYAELLGRGNGKFERIWSEKSTDAP